MIFYNPGILMTNLKDYLIELHHITIFHFI